MDIFESGCLDLLSFSVEGGQPLVNWCLILKKSKVLGETILIEG